MSQCVTAQWCSRGGIGGGFGRHLLGGGNSL